MSCVLCNKLIIRIVHTPQMHLLLSCFVQYSDMRFTCMTCILQHMTVRYVQVCLQSCILIIYCHQVENKVCEKDNSMQASWIVTGIVNLQYRVIQRWKSSQQLTQHDNCHSGLSVSCSGVDHSTNSILYSNMQLHHTTISNTACSRLCVLNLNKE